MDLTQLLDELYALTKVEEERLLTAQETTRYTELYDTLVEAEVPIEFSVII
ncbi:hypothetical protein [Paenibacillus glucanolyticus]|uniref:hypothetical protein n=1 Tax=Paenibacillus glucanolyticus TaxID=59843 RepID=UPI0015C2E89D|nr:hypothetical protein [Paenibacillus glucanolyticus]